MKSYSILNCYRLNVCVSSNFIYENPDYVCVTVKTWELGN